MLPSWLRWARPPLVWGVRRLRALRAGLIRLAYLLAELLLLPVLLVLARASRGFAARRTVDVGLGPEPLINNLHHQQALLRHGYSAETFVWKDNFIARGYDLNLADRPWSTLRKGLYLFVHALFRYRALFIYFNGGPLFQTTLLRRFEPRLYRSAGIRVVVMPFGSDVQVMLRSRNLLFKHALALDYPEQNRGYKRVSRNLDCWSRHADCVLSGCEWVDYMYHWDVLQLAHFSIDLEAWRPAAASTSPASRPLRVLHAPNHKTLKGTAPLRAAVERLKARGVEIELVLLQGVPNTQIRRAIEEVDLVADQFVIGWYAMFAIEAMALEKPALCFLRPDLLDLYAKAGLVSVGEIPLINTSVLEIESKLLWAHEHRAELAEIGRRGRAYVERHHSLEKIGGDFAAILARLGVAPR